MRKGLQKSEEEMRRMAEEMRQANVEKDVFLSTISTSISVPLTSVVSDSLKLASEEVLEVNERKLISENLNKTSAELLELINNILNLSRLEAGMMKFKPESIDMVPFVQGIGTLMQSKGKKVEVSLPEIDRELKVHADIACLQEIFNNVLAGKEASEIRMSVLESGASLQIESFGGHYMVQMADGDSSVSAMVCIKLPVKIPTHSSLSSQTNIRVG